jgi:PmbA protein
MKSDKFTQMSFPELADWVIKRTGKAGADCRVNLRRQRLIEINYRERKPEILREASTRSIRLELFMNKKYAAQSTPDFREDSLESFIDGLVESASIMEEDPYRTLPDPELYSGRTKEDLQLEDPDYQKLTPEERHEMARKMEEICLEKGGDKVISVEAGEYDSRVEEYIRTSNGFEGSTTGTGYQLSASLTAQDEGDRRPYGFDYGVAIYRKDLPDLDKIATEAVRRTFDLFGAKKIPSVTIPVIVENRVASTLLSFLQEPLSGRSIQQKRSFLADKKGKQIGSKLFTIMDDPLITRGIGSRYYDEDGFPTKKREIFSEGTLNDFMINWYYSRKLEMGPTSGSYSNIIIPPGTRSVDEIIKDLPKCLFITNFIGGNSNSTTGDFSIGLFGKLYQNGRFVQNVAEMNIADNHLAFWNKLVEVGNDPWLYSQVRIPSLVFDNVVVSGI